MWILLKSIHITTLFDNKRWINYSDFIDIINVSIIYPHIHMSYNQQIVEMLIILWKVR